MRFLKPAPCCAALILALLCAPALAQPELYSFADVYRLAAAAEPRAGVPEPLAFVPERFAPEPALAWPFAAVPVRAARAEARPSEPRISVGRAPGPEPWLLLLSGLAAAGWVAHRRLAGPL